ncbi:gem nuclear organelle associated protein 8 [Phyllostomus discolor]|uniref:Gem nuclear organelle associated protein 8 n=1 Tax=Phyllostomus discolor TaxID=89673 RepID=A0A7E6D176_9CHIR|nr:gem-associated protein 8 [Phyllostomus discolor]XP_035873013.1 gem-associated protein 8 [Phyllostomus discolor]KAF6090478.1 gem nuclear organelle associated protein 8 [Phyllostomus discolor]
MASQAAPAGTGEPWSHHPAYARYWRHYYQAMAWMRSHQMAYWKAVESYVRSPWYCTPKGHPQGPYAEEGRSPQSSWGHYWASQGSCCRHSHSPWPEPHGPDSTREVRAWAAEEEEEEEEEEDTDSDEGVECDVSNMEITEELRQYFAETERHREERRRQQQLDEQRLEDYVNADHDLYYKTPRSMEPPSERPGEQRQAEMKRLYGDSAAKIQAMEAAVQLSFNKHFDRKRPKYWPVIPLKF